MLLAPAKAVGETNTSVIPQVPLVLNLPSHLKPTTVSTVGIDMSESAMDTEQSVTCGNRVANQIWTLSVGSWLKPRPCPSSMVSIATDASLIADDNEDECGEEGKDEFDSSTQSTEGRLRKAVIDVDTSESALTLRARVGLDTKNKLVDRLREEGA